ncbi:MAG: hypothetical protein GY738_21850 [Pseudoalteromonas sp.]|nr:hypothetical protein [Pseudoalteromonas sp.]
MDNKESDLIVDGCQYRVTLKNGYSFKGTVFTVNDDKDAEKIISSDNSIKSIVRIR